MARADASDAAASTPRGIVHGPMQPRDHLHAPGEFPHCIGRMKLINLPLPINGRGTRCAWEGTSPPPWPLEGKDPLALDRSDGRLVLTLNGPARAFAGEAVERRLHSLASRLGCVAELILAA